MWPASQCSWLGSLSQPGPRLDHQARARSIRYRRYRQHVGKAILLGLELLVAADIIRTVAVRPTLETAGVLAIVVGIRTALSFSLEVELEGRWPWARSRKDNPAAQRVA